MRIRKQYKPEHWIGIDDRWPYQLYIDLLFYTVEINREKARTGRYWGWR
jgi:hypothetical protein